MSTQQRRLSVFGHRRGGSRDPRDLPPLATDLAAQPSAAAAPASAPAAQPRRKASGLFRKKLHIPQSSVDSSITDGSEVSSPSSSRPGSALTMSPIVPQSAFEPSSLPSSSRPSLRKTKRQSSVFGSLKSLRFSEEDNVAPLSAVSTGSILSAWTETPTREEFTNKSRVVVHHGEAQTSSSWRRKKREYLVLTETHLLRYKNQAKAFEHFPQLVPQGRAHMVRNTSSSSFGELAQQENYSLTSDSSGDVAQSLPLEQVVAVSLPDESRPSTTLELAWLDNDLGQGSILTLAFVDADERQLWLRALRQTANAVRLNDPEPVRARYADYALNAVAREGDYDGSHFKIYRIVRRSITKLARRPSADDSEKGGGPVFCFLVIGVNKVHVLSLPRSTITGSSRSLKDLGEAPGIFHGIVTLRGVNVPNVDDDFSLAFRLPMSKTVVYHLSSLAALDLVLELRRRDAALRPLWLQSTISFRVPISLDDEVTVLDETKELNGWYETLAAFSVAYGVDPGRVRFFIETAIEDGPQFILYPADPATGGPYTALELLAIFRSLRYNEAFGSISFAGVSLNLLGSLYDPSGADFLCISTRSGNRLGIDEEEQRSASLLVSELRALAISNRRLRRVDISGCITYDRTSPEQPRPRGCSLLEAMYVLCRYQSTNVDWFCANNIPLSDSDLDYLVSLAAAKTCHVRGLELSGCGLTDRSIHLLLDALMAQANTLEMLDISHNVVRLEPTLLSRPLDCFGFIRSLNLSYVGVSSSSAEPLLGFETLKRWRLEELQLTGIPLNDASVDDLCAYLRHRQSEVLKLLGLASCSLTGTRAARILEAAAPESGNSRALSLDLRENRLTVGHLSIVRAIAQNRTPETLLLQPLEYDSDEAFAELLFAAAKNKSLRHLDISRVSLPAEAGPATCMALEDLLATNTALVGLDISGEESRLEETRLGQGIINALTGLKKNTTLKNLTIQHQRLGRQGAEALADVLQANTTLETISCEHNDISLPAFTVLVNAVSRNRTIQYLPIFDEGRESQMKNTQEEIMAAQSSIDHGGGRPGATASTARHGRHMASVRKTVARLGPSPANKQHDSAASYVSQWTPQDTREALQIVSDKWEEQAQRLITLLDRNRMLATGIDLGSLPVSADAAAAAERERPLTAHSLTRLMEKVTMDRTPRVEKSFEAVGLGIHMADPSSSSATAATSGYSGSPTHHDDVMSSNMSLASSEPSEQSGRPSNASAQLEMPTLTTAPSLDHIQIGGTPFDAEGLLGHARGSGDAAAQDGLWLASPAPPSPEMDSP